MTIPDVHPLTGGRWEAQCGRCLKPSIPVPAVDAAHAWADLVQLGWTLNVDGRAYPVCKTCSENPRSLDERVRSAHKGRRRK